MLSYPATISIHGGLIGMSQDSIEEMATLYVGLTDLPLGERCIDLGDGIFLRGADATFTSSLLLGKVCFIRRQRCRCAACV